MCIVSPREKGAQKQLSIPALLIKQGSYRLEVALRQSIQALPVFKIVRVLTFQTGNGVTSLVSVKFPWFRGW